MGYDLHITRADSWMDSEMNPISPSEWMKIVELDPELTLAGYNGPYFTLWIGPSGYEEYEEPWFNWRKGRIVTKNPDVPTIRKMIEIAERLNATVQGDDGEVYSGPETNKSLESR